MDSLNKERSSTNTKARDLAEISTVACYIATNIFKLESERLRALSGINKLTNKASQQIFQLICCIFGCYLLKLWRKIDKTPDYAAAPKTSRQDHRMNAVQRKI